MTVCRGCKIEFTSKRNGQKYHSRECFLNSTVKMVTCVNCGTKFKKMFSKQVCCSKKCSYLYRAKKMTKGIMVHCSLSSCNKEIYRMPSRIKKYNFCCLEHRVIYQKSPENKDFGRGWKHKPEEIEKIRVANFKRDYNISFTEKTRQKFRETVIKNIVTHKWDMKSKHEEEMKNILTELGLVEKKDFIHQYRIGNWVFDFFIISRNLVVETDDRGHYHDKKLKAKDKIKGVYLKENNYLILRFRDSEIYNNKEGVKTIINQALQPCRRQFNGSFC